MQRLAVFAILLGMTVPVFAKGPKYTDPNQVDADYAYQGEYEGTFQTEEGKTKFGVHVIAESGGKFRLVGYHGGLPGAGWTGEGKSYRDGGTEGRGRALYQ